MTQSREILAYRALREVRVLVPKKRGVGFVKSPWYHSPDAALLDACGGYDAYGLDGSLDLQCGYDGRDDVFTRVMPLLSAHYGAPWREVGPDEFWRSHPIPAPL